VLNTAVERERERESMCMCGMWRSQDVWYAQKIYGIHGHWLCSKS